MGTFGKKIVQLKVEELIEHMNKALADEWLAYYQYWVGAKVVKGINSAVVEKELLEHASEELKHAEMLTERIIELGGIPLLDPKLWQEKTNCGYDAPKDFCASAILKQNIRGEQCAIKVYQKLLDLTKDKDPISYQMFLDILKEEVTHENDLEKILEDLGCCK